MFLNFVNLSTVEAMKDIRKCMILDANLLHLLPDVGESGLKRAAHDAVE